MTLRPPTHAGAKPPRLLMVAFHFPPLAGSSGIQRTLRFVQHLPAHGWQPVVLGAHPRAFERCADDLLKELPADLPIFRAQAFDTARHLALRGRYWSALARPDRWLSWWPFAVHKGLRAIRSQQAKVIWSTYPIATAHLIGFSLQRLTGLPWIADFRDPMAQDDYPSDAKTWRRYHQIEGLAMRHAAACVFTTPSAAQTYRERYPAYANKVVLIENGYDEESFAGLSLRPRSHEAGPITLLHSGLVYPAERDPGPLLAALASLAKDPAHPAARIRLRFRAAVHEDLLARLAEQHGVAERIEILPPVPYRAALEEMVSAADALLILQAASCNQQIPAKLYEYLRAGRPLIGLTDAAGDTAGVMRKANCPYLAPLDDAEAIADCLRRFAEAYVAGHCVLPDAAAVSAASRAGRAAQFAALLASVVRR